jgi:cell division protein FtsQ
MFTYYTIVVTNVPVLKTDSANNSVRSSIVKIVKYVERDSFWNSQITQISVTQDLGFELVPVLGTHKIVFGDTTRMEEKFINLFAFYKKVLNRIGWEKYENVDVRFKDQVVASPALPWKPSSKNATSNMDWLKSIMDEAVKETVVVSSVQKPQVIAFAANAKNARESEAENKAKNTIKHPGNTEQGKYIYHGTKKN